MNIDPKITLWLAATVVAVVGLARLMRNRQVNLLLLLQRYVEEQRQWSRKRNKAARLARKLALNKAESESHRDRILDDPDDHTRDDHTRHAPDATAAIAPHQKPAERVA